MSQSLKNLKILIKFLKVDAKKFVKQEWNVVIVVKAFAITMKLQTKTKQVMIILNAISPV